MTKTMLRRAAIVAALALGTAGLAACGSDDGGDAKPAAAADVKAVSKADLSGVTLRIGVQKDGIRGALQRSGELDGLPYKIDWSVFQFGPPLVEAAGADKIDLAWVGSTPPIFGAAAGSRFKIIAAVQERDRQENSLLVPKGSTAKTIADLKGKKIAVAKGSSAHGWLLNALQGAGLTLKDVKPVYLAPADGLAAFSSGRVDAWIVWDPFVQQAEQQAGAKAIAGGEPNERGVGFEIASTKTLQDPVKLAAIQDYLGRLSRAWQWSAKNPDGWAEAWTKDSKLPLSVTKVAAVKKASDIVPVSQDIVDREQKLSDLLSDQKVLPKPVTFSDIVQTGVYDPTPAR